MPRRPANLELLAQLGRVLRRLRLPWYVFGAQAVVFYGRPRMTEDVDVTVGELEAALGDVELLAPFDHLIDGKT